MVDQNERRMNRPASLKVLLLCIKGFTTFVFCRCFGEVLHFKIYQQGWKQKTVLTHTHFNSNNESHYKVFTNYFLFGPIGIHLTFFWTTSVQLQYQQWTLKSKREVCEFKWRILICFNTSPYTVVQRKKWGIYVKFDPRIKWPSNLWVFFKSPRHLVQRSRLPIWISTCWLTTFPQTGGRVLRCILCYLTTFSKFQKIIEKGKDVLSLGQGAFMRFSGRKGWEKSTESCLFTK